MGSTMAAEFEDHLRRCGPCRREVELERFSKHLVQHHVEWRTTPSSAREAILYTLRREFSFHQALTGYESGGGIPRNRFTQMALGALAAVFFFSQVTTRVSASYTSTAHTACNDLINQAFKNFALAKSGKFQPASVTGPPESLRSYFQQSTLRFGVQVASLPNCDWSEGSATDGGGVQQAHLLYKLGNELLYVSEVSNDEALQGTHTSLPPAAKRALVQSGWYTDPEHPNCNVVLWKTDEAVCVAVSTMKKEQMLTLLTSR